MSQEPQQQQIRRTGRAMQIVAWVLGLGLLTLVFQDFLETRLNPNTQPLVRVDGDGLNEVVLERNVQGHYVASGAINGLPVTFLLDTGATDVAIPETLAQQLQLERRGGGISQTANGPVAVWHTRLDDVQLGSIRLQNVRASIVPSMGQGSPVLLGMSFLKQLEFTQRDGHMTLRQIR